MREAERDEARAEVKIVLVPLSGDAKRARALLQERYPRGTIEEMSRAEIEHGSLGQRLGVLRARRPGIFAVSTERLAWQRGQNAFLLFGALAGARRSLILDAYGGIREEARGRIMLRGPARLAREAAISSMAVARARRRLRRLERAISAGRQSSRQPARNGGRHREALEIVYLRATPGPGTQLGGAASHINGFINAARNRARALARQQRRDRRAGRDSASAQSHLAEARRFDARGL